MTAIHADQRAAEAKMKPQLERIPEGHRASARNLLHIIRRMETHQAKKTPTLRPLRVASEAFARKE